MILKMCWHILTFVAKEGNFLFTSGTEKLCTMWGKTRYAHYMNTTKDTLQWTTTLLFFEEHDFDFMAIIYRAYVGIHWCMKNLYHKHHYTSFLLTLSLLLLLSFVWPRFRQNFRNVYLSQATVDAHMNLLFEIFRSYYITWN